MNNLMLFIIMLLVNYILYTRSITEIKNENNKLKNDKIYFRKKYYSLHDDVTRLIYKIKELPEVNNEDIELKIKKETMEQLSKYLEDRLKENVKWLNLYYSSSY